MSASPDPDATLRAAAREAAAGRDLDGELAEVTARALLADGAGDAAAAALLTALARKGHAAGEVAALVRVVLAAAPHVPWDGTATADLVGTGGDGSGSVNLSTLAALVAVAGGATVAKAGNRATTSACGSADLLEALGVPIAPGPLGIAGSLLRHRFAFIHTPALHTAVGRWTRLRRRLGIRTLFNLSGPLSNPVADGPRLIGVADPREQDVLAEAAHLLGHRRTWVVRGGEGLDEVSTACPTRVLEVTGSGVRPSVIDPAELPVRPARVADLKGGDTARAAALAEALLSGTAPDALRDAVAANAGVLLRLTGHAADLVDGVGRARDALASGAALRLLDALRAPQRHGPAVHPTPTDTEEPLHASR
ncbi:anthranilate phosphoribosyltransferase [Streptomyces sp. NPDC059063]|uniref:anthranilate phosphoribosyltransferase n=1 Tax=unclassified Streptomyces TaxID=2593676 RepID=UPI0036A79B29